MQNHTWEASMPVGQVRVSRNEEEGPVQLLMDVFPQILAMASKMKKDALRLVHTGTLTTFSNWPTSRSDITIPPQNRPIWNVFHLPKAAILIKCFRRSCKQQS